MSAPAFKDPPQKNTGTKIMAIELGAKKPTASGGSSRCAIQKDGADLEWKASVQTAMPWQPNSYDSDSNTLDFCFKPSPELVSFVSELEAAVVAQVSKDPKAYFGENLSPAAVQALFQSNLRTSQQGAEYFKAKARCSNIAFWDKDGKPMNEPTVWGREDEYLFVVRATAVWFGSKGWGIACDLKHLQVFSNKCPF